VPDAVVGYDVHCTGPAWLQSRATGVVVLLDDGSLFAWDSNGLAAAVYPPYVEQQDGQGDRIWMSFEQRDVLAAGAFAGTFRTQSLVIRDGEGGRIRFLARQGAIVPDLAPTDIYDLFGVGATSQPACTPWVRAACSRLASRLCSSRNRSCSHRSRKERAEAASVPGNNASAARS